MSYYISAKQKQVAGNVTGINASKPVQKKGGIELQDNRRSGLIQRKELASLVSQKGDVAQLSTKLQPVSLGKYKYDNDSESETAGMHAEAYLDPADPVNGSAPSGSALSGVMGDLSNLGYKSMIKGHLLNGQLGGPGVAENLFPITSSANSKHKNFAENVIKQHIAYGGHHGIYYSVEVTDANYSTKNPSGKFTCEAYYWNQSKGHSHSAVDKKQAYLKPLDIESTPAKGSTGFGQVVGLNTGVDAFGNNFNYSSNAPSSISFPNKKLPSGWGEIGSGRGSGGRDWSHIKGMDMG